MTGDARKGVADKKFAPNWEGLDRVNQSLGNGAFILLHLDGDEISNTWNADHLKFYLS